MLGIPNGTAVNQEMDQAYASFQPAVKRSTQRVVNIKLAERVAARKMARQAKVANLPLADAPPPLAVSLEDLEDMLDNTSDDEREKEGLAVSLEELEDMLDNTTTNEGGNVLEEEGKIGNPDKVPDPLADFDGVVAEQDHTLGYKGSIMNVGLGNLDLGKTVNE